VALKVGSRGLGSEAGMEGEDYGWLGDRLAADLLNRPVPLAPGRLRLVGLVPIILWLSLGD
jgi:hypothetical protein